MKPGEATAPIAYPRSAPVSAEDTLGRIPKRNHRRYLGRSMMHLGKYCSTVIATAVGLGVAVTFVSSTDVATLRATVLRVGLAAPVVVAIRLGVVTLAGLGWAPLIAASERVSLAVLVGLRFVREAVNVLLPVASVGGDVVGGRLLTRWSVPAGPGPPLRASWAT